jgi:4-amino-4-deoxy-L-arabinose transferase-like glycosyltransferase
MSDGKDGPLLPGTLADDEAAMRKGRVGSLAILIGLGVAAAAGLAFLMSGDDEARVYGEIGKKVNGLERANFAQFWGCVLQGENLADLRSNSDLTTHVNVRGLERGRSYGLHARDTCLPKLQEINPQLATLIVPTDLQSDVEALKRATSELRGAWSDFVVYLDDPELEYSEDKARPLIAQIARGWYDFKKAHGAINQKIKAKLK